MTERFECRFPQGTMAHLEFSGASAEEAFLSIVSDSGARMARAELCLPAADLEQFVIWLSGCLLRRRRELRG